MWTRWRYFRVGGDPPEYTGDNLLTLAIHHGGRFYSNAGIYRVYKGGQTLYLDVVDPDKMSLTEVHNWAYDIGYCEGPICFMYKIPGSEEGSGYLPMNKDADVVDIVCLAPKTTTGCLDIYIVCFAARKSLEDLEAETNPVVNHQSYVGHSIDDLPLNGVDDEGRVVIEDVVPLEMIVDETFVLNDEELLQQTFGGGWENAERREEAGGEPERREEAGGELERREETGGEHEHVELGEGSGTKRKRRKGKEPVREVDEDRDGYSDDSDDSDDPDYEIVDNDYELVEEDDDDAEPDEFTRVVDGDISDQNADADSDILDSGDDDSENGGKKKKFRNWVQFDEDKDMKEPKFCLGMLFADVKIFRRAIKKHSVLSKKEVRFRHNGKNKCSAVCKTSVGCSWYIYASAVSDGNPTLQFRVYRNEHQCCTIEKKVYHCTAPFLAQHYGDQFTADENWSRHGIQNVVSRDLGMAIGHQLAYRAKVKAIQLVRGTLADQFNNLDSYAHELKKRNPSTSVWMKIQLEGDVARFLRFYVCFAALKEGWMAGCRPILGLDGCHLKGIHKGQLLSAVGIDGNNGMYPVAWAVVEAETTDSWTWFLEFLKEDLDIYQTIGYAFISDKQKGLEQAVSKIFPDAEHRFCVRHMVNNFKNDGHIKLNCKLKLWAIARASTMVRYKKAMEYMQAECVNAWQWCLDRPAKQWSRSHFKEVYKCDILLNNHSESFNKSILEARKKPIISCLEDITVAAMVRLAARRKL